MTDNIYALFESRFAGRLDALCLVSPEGRIWTYGDLEAWSAKFAAFLIGAGARAGDRIVAQIDKSPAAVALYLGALRAGLAFAPLNTAYTPHEVGHFLKDAEPRVFFCRPEAAASLGPIAQGAGLNRVVALGVGRDDPLLSEVESCAPIVGAVPRDNDDLAALIYTSGTTGRSKGAMVSHGNLASNALALSALWGFKSDDVLLHALPIFHIHGLFVALHTAFLSASKILFLPGFDAADMRRRLSDATVMMGVPTFYTRLLDEPGFGAADCAGMRLFISGSAPLTARDSNRFAERTGHRILERYGMSEAGMIASNPLNGARIPGTVGFALPGVDVRVCNADGEEAPRGEAGVIEVKGPNIFPGYWRMPEATAREFRSDGFFITGDLGTIDAEGRLKIVGRSKDLIISGGYNIYPKEIESVLDDIPGVQESAVIGAPHKDLGEGVVAVLVPEMDALPTASIQGALDERLAKFKHPRRIFWEKSLPRNAMGKVQKAALRAKYAKAYDR